MPGKHEMSKGDSSRIQSTQATSGRDMSSRGFAARAQSAGDRNMNASFGGAGKGKGVGGGQNAGNGNGNGGQGRGARKN